MRHPFARKRAALWLALLLAGLLLAVAQRPAAAQTTICGDDLVPLQAPPGTYPSTTSFCGVDDGRLSNGYGGDMPCGGAILGYSTWPIGTGEDYIITMIPPTNQLFPSGQAKISFLWAGFSTITGLGINEPDTSWTIRTFSSAGQQIAATQIRADDPSVDIHIGNNPCGDAGWFCVGPAYWYYVTVTLAMPNQYGYVHVQASGRYKSMFTSFRVGDAAGGAPGMCDVPGAPTPTPEPSATPDGTATNTPTATLTSTPTETPTGTPPTPTLTGTPTATDFSTAPPPDETWTPRPTQPAPTSTPIILVTVPAQATPTPFGNATMPPLILATADLPEPGLIFPTPPPITVDGTPISNTVNVGDISTRTAEMMIIVTRWYTTTEQAFTWIDPTITTTTGISSPVQIAAMMAESVAAPISWIRAIQYMMPNAWPMVLAALLSLAWMVFIIIAKFAIAVIAEVIEVIRKLIELIPGM